MKRITDKAERERMARDREDSLTDCLSDCERVEILDEIALLRRGGVIIWDEINNLVVRG